MALLCTPLHHSLLHLLHVIAGELMDVVRELRHVDRRNGRAPEEDLADSSPDSHVPRMARHQQDRKRGSQPRVPRGGLMRQWEQVDPDDILHEGESRQERIARRRRERAKDMVKLNREGKKRVEDRSQTPLCT